MNLVPTFSWLTQLRWQRARPAAPPDLADMGTAFGLDASMGAEPPSTMPAFFLRSGRPEEAAPDSGGFERRTSHDDPRPEPRIDRRSRV
jgi:hypothetical protein